MRAKRLTAQQALVLWRQFYDAYGPAQMIASYGSPDVPTIVSPNRRIWAFYEPDVGDGDVVIGWGSVELNTLDADDDKGYLVIGVFPEHQGRGYHVDILNWLAKWAKKNGAKWATMTVMKSNKAHHERTMKRAQDGPWLCTGESWFPPDSEESYFALPLTEEAKALVSQYRSRSQAQPEAAQLPSEPR